MLSPKLPRLFARVLGLLVLPATVALAAPSPFLRYGFHDGAKDSSGNLRDGSLAGTAQIAIPPDDVNRALDNRAATMAGAGGGVSFASPKGLPAFKSFTVTQWFRSTGAPLASGARLFDFSGLTGTADSLLLAASTNTGKIALNRGGTALVANGTNNALLASTDTWVFVALVHDGAATSNNLRLYVGSDTASVSLIAQTTVTGPVWAGGNGAARLVFGTNQNSTRSLKGWMDDLRIYGDMSGSAGALSSEELDVVRLERNHQRLLLHHDFNSYENAVAPDLSGNGRTGTLAGGAQWNKRGPSGKLSDTAFDNRHSTMSGAGGSLVTPGTLGTFSSFTLTLWYHAEGQSPKGATRLFDNGTQMLAFDGLDTAASGKIIFKSGSTEMLRDSTDRPLFTNADTWVFLALTYDGTTTRLYGGNPSTAPVELLAKTVTTPGAFTFATTPLYFGSNTTGGRALDGLIDNIRLYGAQTGTTGALTLTEIENIYFAEQQVSDVSTVAPAIWAGHPVNFALLTHGDRQYVGYYDDTQRMTIASRRVGSAQWTRKPLQSYIGTDTHNYITLAVDSAGQLHVAGNMHDVPLAGYGTPISLYYFRTTTAGDVTSLTPSGVMVATADETKMTYPTFITKDGELFFTYRNGISGAGATFLNKYTPATSAWSRVSKLFDGYGSPNNSAYPIGPIKGPDNKWHMSWVWRQTPSTADSNHSLSYAWSNDLVTWQTSTCQPITLPITPATPGVVIDPIPTSGGILNGSGLIGFDQDNKVVISYHKYDGPGPGAPTKIYLMRRNINGTWQSACVTPNWTYRWELGGAGSIAVDVAHTALGYKAGLGHYLGMRNPNENGNWLIDPVTLARIGAPIPADTVPGYIPSDHFTVQRPEPGMGVRRMTDFGISPAGLRHVLRWETLPVNRDLPPETIPAPGELKIVTLPAE